MKVGLVLCGGGAKGAYEAGAIRALDELGYKFNLVTGTSIGALNGLLVTQKDYDALYKLWDEISIEKVLANPIDFTFSINSLMNQSNLLKSFFKSYINEKGADITPLKEMCMALYDGDKAKKSDIDYGVVTVRYPSLKPLEITKDKMTSKNMIDYAFASAACFPAFPMYKIGRNNYIDGGYFDNLPISLAQQMGAEEIIAIELNTELTHAYYNNRPNITIISPSEDLGDFLDFNREVIDYRIKLGYNDTMKKLGHYKGYKYMFENIEIDQAKLNVIYNKILKLENDYNRRYIKKYLTGDDSIPLTAYLQERSKKNYLDLEDYYFLCLECILDMYEMPVDMLYNPDTVGETIFEVFNKKYQAINYEFPQKINNKTVTLIKKSVQGVNGFAFTALMYHHLLINKNIDLKKIPNVLIKEFICALFLYCEYGEKYAET